MYHLKCSLGRKYTCNSMLKNIIQTFCPFCITSLVTSGQVCRNPDAPLSTKQEDKKKVPCLDLPVAPNV